MAIVGIGAIGEMHARAITEIENAEVVAGCCRTESKGRKFVEQFGGSWYADAQQMMDDAKPDIITICTPSGAHLEPTLAAARRGIHVLCEKPMEITLARIDQMITAAKEAGIMLGGIFPQRFNPVIQTLQQAAIEGRYGDLSVASAHVPWWRDDAYYSPDRWQGTMALDGGGALMNQSIHGVDAVQWIVGATMNDLEPGQNPVEQVFAFTAKRGHDESLIEVEDTVVAVLRFRNGTLGQLLGATSMYPGSFKRIQIAGRNGTAEVLEDELITWRFRQEHAEDEAKRKRFGPTSDDVQNASDPMAFSADNHVRNIRAFLESVDDKSHFAIDGVEARKAVAIVTAAYESAATGKAVTLN